MIHDEYVKKILNKMHSDLERQAIVFLESGYEVKDLQKIVHQETGKQCIVPKWIVDCIPIQGVTDDFD